MCPLLSPLFFFFFNDTATTEIYTLSLHDALPISLSCHLRVARPAILAARRIHLALLTLTGLFVVTVLAQVGENPCFLDRKSTRLNSSHGYISYAVFCLKKKKRKIHRQRLMIIVMI